MGKKPAPGRTRSNDPAAMPARVLMRTAEAFQSHGYHPTSTHDIMRAAGVSGGALHHHFPTKKALAVAVIRERVARAVEQTWIEPIRSANTAAQGILGVFEQIANRLEEHNVVLGCPLGNLAIELSLAAPDSEMRSRTSSRTGAGHRAEAESRPGRGNSARTECGRVRHVCRSVVFGLHCTRQGGTSGRSVAGLCSTAGSGDANAGSKTRSSALEP